MVLMRAKSKGKNNRRSFTRRLRYVTGFAQPGNLPAQRIYNFDHDAVAAKLQTASSHPSPI
jgi:hypothetical protein